MGSEAEQLAKRAAQAFAGKVWDAFWEHKGAAVTALLLSFAGVVYGWFASVTAPGITVGATVCGVAIWTVLRIRATLERWAIVQPVIPYLFGVRVGVFVNADKRLVLGNFVALCPKSACSGTINGRWEVDEDENKNKINRLRWYCTDCPWLSPKLMAFGPLDLDPLRNHFNSLMLKGERIWDDGWKPKE